VSDDEQVEVEVPPGAAIAELEGHLWAIRPAVLGELFALAADGRFLEAVRGQAPEAAKRRGRPRKFEGGIEVVPLKGVLMPMGLLGMLFGLENPLDTFTRRFEGAMADAEVGAVVLDVDSPGGVVDFIPETAAIIRAAKGKKPITAVANTLAASAAYWLASQADELSVTPSGEAGSIGVYAAHRDISGQLELAGIKNTLIHAGKYKIEGNPWEPLSDEAREHIQGDVDAFYDMFTADVAKGRGVKQKSVEEGYGEGRVLNAREAVKTGLADRVETLGEAVARLSGRSRGSVAQAEADAGADDTVAEAEAGADEDAYVLTPDEKRELHDVLLALNIDRLQDAIGV
jgi:signal peptide peptidase SppA